MKWLWRSKELSESLKLRLFCVHVLSTVVWGHEAWSVVGVVVGTRRPLVPMTLEMTCVVGSDAM
eukprot:SAG31_NODE_48334_length_193_cov_750.691489_1_plen_63_part_11